MPSNLADGLDGLAGGICLLSLGCLGYLAYLEEQWLITLLVLALSGAIFGFLRFNTYPATVFMGDTGSELIGFSLIVLTLNLTQGNTALGQLLPLLIIGFPILDTSLVMVRRMIEKRPIFVADKSHLHHRLLGLDSITRRRCWQIYLAQAAFVVAALVFRFHSDWRILGMYALISLVILGGLTRCRAEKVAFQPDGCFRQGGEGAPEGAQGARRLCAGIVWHHQIGCGRCSSCLPVFCPKRCLVILLLYAVLSDASSCLATVVRKPWIDWFLVIMLYLFIPFIVFLGETEGVSWFVGLLPRLYSAAFAVLALFVILTLRWTVRQEGFRMTPMHFLIILHCGSPGVSA